MQSKAWGQLPRPSSPAFSITVAFQTIELEGSLRWPDAALALLLLAAFTLAACVQFAFRARLYAVTPTELEAWWPEADTWERALLKDEQLDHRKSFRRWSRHSNRAYNIGILLFLLGVGVSLIPPDPISRGRIVVLVLVAAACAAELTWVVAGTVLRRPYVLPSASSTDQNH